jgi:hypothetical protein
VTGLELLGKARAVLGSRWTLPAVMVVVGLVLTCRLNAGRQAEAEAKRLLEAERLREAGQVVTVRERAARLEERVRELAGENAELARALEESQRASPGAKAVGVVRASTGAVVAAGAPRAARPAPPAASIEVEKPETPPAPACLLAAGDGAEVRIDQVMLETKGGNHLLVGTAAAYRLTPTPAALLFGGPFRAELTEAAEKASPAVAAPRWGAGAWVGVGREGWAVGPAVAAPPVRLWRLQLEGIAGAGLGPGGEWQGGATSFARW